MPSFLVYNVVPVFFVFYAYVRHMPSISLLFFPFYLYRLYG